MSEKLFDVIDFEASSLGVNSYPIEIGWTNGAQVHSLLIEPVEGWTDWDNYAETKIHHISRQLLADEGVTPQQALQAINDDFGVGILWCDGGQYDAHWLTRLEDAAGFKATFRLGFIQSMLDIYHGVSAEAFSVAKTQVLLQDKLKPKENAAQQYHRAGYDASMIKRALYSAVGYY